MSRETRAAWLAALLLLAALPAYAQETSAPEAAVPQAIQVPHVSEQAELLNERLRSISERARPQERTLEIAERLPQFEKDLKAREKAAAEALAAEQLAGLDELEREWRELGDELSGWGASLQSRASELEKDVVDLDRLAEIWKLTRTAAAKSGAPAAITKRARQAQSDISASRKLVSDRLAQILTLQNRVSQGRQAVAGTVAALDEARGRARSRLLQADSPPLWALEGEADGVPLVERIGGVVERHVASLRAYVVLHRTTVLLHGLFVLLAIALTWYLKPHARSWAEMDEGFRSVAWLFERPVAMGLLLGLVASPWIYPNAPLALNNLLGLALLVPLLRQMPRLLPGSLRPGLFAMAGFYLLDGVRDLLVAAPLLARWLFLIECVGGFVGLLWLLRPARLVGLTSVGPGLRALGAAARVATVLFGLAIVLNVTGYLELSLVLGDGVLRSVYMGALVFAGVTVVNGLLRALLRVRPLRLLNVVGRHRSAIVQRAASFTHIVAVLAWAYTALSAFALDDLVIGSVRDLLTARAEIGTMSISLIDFVVFGVTVAASLYLARALRTLLEDDVVPRVSLPRGVGNAMATSVQYVVAALGFFIALQAAGIDMNRFALVAGALGVGIGFGLQNVVNNFVSGIILLFERPVQVGDSVETGQLIGEVRRIGIRSSTIRTWQGAEVIVPNAFLISERVINWTMSDRQRRIELPVGVAYGTDPERVIAILGEVAKQHPDVLGYPTPKALFRGFGDSSLDFELRAWTPLFESFMQVSSDLAVAINRELKAAGITIPFPQRDLHVMSVDPAAGKALSGRAPESDEKGGPA